MGLKVVAAITPKQISQLLKYSKKDPKIRKFTSDPSRFKDKRSFEKWRKEERVIYTLVDKKENLCGLIWFGKNPLPSAKFTKRVKRKDFAFTFAIRTYDKIRGRRQAFDFMRRAFDLFASSKLYKSVKNKGVWLVTSYGNAPAIKIYEKYGFVKVTNPDDKGKILMVFLKK